MGFFAACAAPVEGFGVGFFAAAAAPAGEVLGVGFFAAAAGLAAGFPVTVPDDLFCPAAAVAAASLLFAACARAKFAAFVLAKLLCFSLGPIVLGAGVLGFDGAAPLFTLLLYFGIPVILAASLFRVNPKGFEADPARVPGAPVASRT